jgi:hypothetical protein
VKEKSHTSKAIIDLSKCNISPSQSENSQQESRLQPSKEEKELHLTNKKIPESAIKKQKTSRRNSLSDIKKHLLDRVTSSANKNEYSFLGGKKLLLRKADSLKYSNNVSYSNCSNVSTTNNSAYKNQYENAHSNDSSGKKITNFTKFKILPQNSYVAKMHSSNNLGDYSLRDKIVNMKSNLDFLKANN